MKTFTSLAFYIHIPCIFTLNEMVRCMIIKHLLT